MAELVDDDDQGDVGAFTNPDTLAALQKDVSAQAAALDVAATACHDAKKVDDATFAQWRLLKARVDAWAKATPFLGLFGTGGLTDQGESLQREMLPWFARFVQAGCSNVPAAPPPPPTTAAESFFTSLPPALIILGLVLLAGKFRR